MTDLTKLAQIVALADAATPGPWGFDERYDGGPCHVWAPRDQLKMVDGELAYVEGREDLADLRKENAAANASLIVALRNLVPDLAGLMEAVEATRLTRRTEFCLIVSRDGDPSPLRLIGADVVSAGPLFLDGYALVPLEDYENYTGTVTQIAADRAARALTPDTQGDTP